MTQKDKELLLKDLCARLVYMPKVKITYQQQGIKGTDEGNVSCDFIEKIVNDLRNGVITNMQIYLRPMQSMTEEEKEEFYDICTTLSIDKNHFIMEGSIDSNYMLEKFDWLNTRHFDYRNLIEKGLAIEVTKENNPYKE